jgi:hypothetical protein
MDFIIGLGRKNNSPCIYLYSINIHLKLLHMNFTKDEICKMFNCSMNQLNTQYARNAKTLATMRDKAKKTGKKVNGYTYKELAEKTATYEKLSK